MKKKIIKKINEVKEKGKRLLEDILTGIFPKKLVPVRVRGDDRRYRR